MQAATSILLLQDLFVAPLLVLLPFIVGQGVTDFGAISELTFKATFGFGSVLFAGSYLLRQLFEVVAASRSADTFVALSLCVAAGMGGLAQMLGLTDTAGAFAAGVLLANSNFKYEIAASILPFKGILLGIFFVDAGSNFDYDLLLREGPTIATGVAFLLLLKAATMWLAGYFDRFLPTATNLSPAENVRLAVLLSGGGEFAFVVLAAAEKLGALPEQLNGLLTTIVLITMSLTPFLGVAAAKASEPLTLLPHDGVDIPRMQASREVRAAHDAIVICGYGEVGSSVTRSLIAAAEGAITWPDECIADDFLHRRSGCVDVDEAAIASIICFDLNPSRMPRGSKQQDGVLVLFGDGANAELVRSTGVTEPRAIIITYREPARCLSATQRLRTSFPKTPIFARAFARREQEALIACGASATILETEELAVQLGACLFLDKDSFQLQDDAESQGGQQVVGRLTAWEKAVRALRTASFSPKKNSTDTMQR